jgi:hypothetical protein
MSHYVAAGVVSCHSLFNLLNNAYSEYHTASEELAVDEVIACFKGRIIFKHCITKEHMHFAVTIFKECDCHVMLRICRWPHGEGQDI